MFDDGWVTVFIKNIQNIRSDSFKIIQNQKNLENHFLVQNQGLAYMWQIYFMVAVQSVIYLVWCEYVYWLWRAGGEKWSIKGLNVIIIRSSSVIKGHLTIFCLLFLFLDLKMIVMLLLDYLGIIKKLWIYFRTRIIFIF